MYSEEFVRARAIFGELHYPVVKERVLSIARAPSSLCTPEQIMSDYSLIALAKGIDFALSEGIYQKSLQKTYFLSQLAHFCCH